MFKNNQVYKEGQEVKHEGPYEQQVGKETPSVIAEPNWGDWDCLTIQVFRMLRGLRNIQDLLGEIVSVIDRHFLPPIRIRGSMIP